MTWQTTYGIAVLAAVSSFAVCGCGENKSDLVSATGIVNYQGKPVAGATVTMVLDNKLSTGFTDSQGKFKMTTGGRPGVPVGALKVGITKYAAGAPTTAADTKKMKPEDMMNMQKAADGTAQDLKPKSEIPEKYADPERSSLVANTEKEASKNVFQYDLVD